MQTLPDLRRQTHPSIGVCLSLLCPEVIEVCGVLGFKWVLLDAEHTPLDHAACRNLVRAADVVGLPCIVRVPEIRASVVEGFLDSGALGIIAPNVSSAADAAALVAAVKFSPEGQRGAGSRTRAARYGVAESQGTFYRGSNATTLTVALIESRTGIDALEAIMDVPGLDYVAIGANDLALSMGVQAPLGNPTFQALLADTHARIKARRKPRVAVVTDSAQANEAIAAGAHLLAIPDTMLLADAARTFLARLSV